jgi:hypothetical protein
MIDATIKNSQDAISSARREMAAVNFIVAEFSVLLDDISTATEKNNAVNAMGDNYLKAVTTTSNSQLSEAAQVARRAWS